MRLSESEDEIRIIYKEINKASEKADATTSQQMTANTGKKTRSKFISIQMDKNTHAVMEKKAMSPQIRSFVQEKKW